MYNRDNKTISYNMKTGKTKRLYNKYSESLWNKHYHSLSCLSFALSFDQINPLNVSIPH